MLPSLLPASLIKVLSLPQKFNITSASTCKLAVKFFIAFCFQLLKSHMLPASFIKVLFPQKSNCLKLTFASTSLIFYFEAKQKQSTCCGGST